MTRITEKTLEILRRHAYSEVKPMKDILEAVDLSRAALTNVVKSDGDFNLSTCEAILNECGFALKIVSKSQGEK